MGTRTGGIRSYRIAHWLSVLLLLTLSGATGARAATAPPPWPSIRVSPAAGPAGTRVTIRGTVPGMTAAGRRFSMPTICINGCVNGFTESGVPVQWVSADQFVLHLTIPREPLLTGRGVLVLRPGDYAIGVTCVESDIRGCAGVTQASAPFRVTGRAPTRCTAGHGCAYMRLSANRVYPGEVVRVKGWAPLTPIIGQPFGYTLVLSPKGHSSITAQLGQPTQRMNGNFSGSFRVPALVPGLGAVQAGGYTVGLFDQLNGATGTNARTSRGIRIVTHYKTVGAGGRLSFSTLFAAPTALTIAAPPTWKSLGRLQPISSLWSLPLPFDGSSQSTADFAYCVPGGIELTRSGGTTWRLVPTGEASRRSMMTDFPIGYSSSTPLPDPNCQSVTLDPGYPNTLYATFPAINRQYGSMPPVYYVLYETRNLGETWEPVPAPVGYALGQYGGITVSSSASGQGEAISAIFARTAESQPQGQGLQTQGAVAMTTNDGGATWRQTPLTCPRVRPCLRFGAMENSFNGMGTLNVQPLLLSSDGGKSWQTLEWPTGNTLGAGVFSGQSELVFFPHGEVIYVDAASQYPVRLSSDGGRDWKVVSLPLPGGVTAASLRASGQTPYAALMLLGKGYLLAAAALNTGGYRGTWWTLAPGATHWTKAAGIDAPGLFGRLVISGDRIVWPTVVGMGNTGLELRGVSSQRLPGKVGR